MISYWAAFFLVFSIFLANLNRPKWSKAGWCLGLAFVVFVGLRYQVGGDWGSYLRHLALIRGLGFIDAITFGDPGYYALNWLASNLGLGIGLVNFVCAIVVVYGISRFSAEQPNPWLAYLIAVPYLLIVVSMGYTRQSAALGFAMVALTELANNKQRRFVYWIILAALFHKSAVLLLPIAALSAAKNRVWTAIWVGAIGLIATNLLLLDSADDLWQNYVEADYQSEGALVRVFMNAVPSVIYLLYRKKLSSGISERRLWTWMSIFSLCTIPIVFMSSTAVDRIALYFIPIQLFVFSRLPFLGGGAGMRVIIALCVAGYYFLVQFVWLNFAGNAPSWLPYDNYFFYLFSPSGMPRFY